MRWLTLQQLKSKNAATRLQTVEKLAAEEDLDAVGPLISVLGDESPEVRKCAAKALGKLRAIEAVEPLMALMRDPVAEVRQLTATALKQIGDKTSTPALAAAMRDQNAAVRYHVVAALDSLGWMPRDETERALRCVALGKLMQAAHYGIAAIDPLVGELQTGVHYKRVEAVEALAKIGDPRVIKPLTAALKDEDPSVRTKAVESLSKLGDARGVEALIGALRDRDNRVRAAAVEALGKIGDERCLQALSGLLKDSSTDVRKAAAEALTRCADPAAVDLWLNVTDDADSEVRQIAVVALGKLNDKRAITPLVVMLTDGHEAVRQAAETALRKLDKEWERSHEAMRAVPALEAAQQSEEYWVRQNAMLILKRIVGEPAPAAPAESEGMTTMADRATLRRKDAVGVLNALLCEKDRDLRLAGIHGMFKMAGNTAVPRFVELLTDTDSSVRFAAANSLQALDWQPETGKTLDWALAWQQWDDVASVGSAAVEPLGRLSSDTNPEIRRSAAETLGKIGGAEVIEPLMLFLNDTEKQVRKAAAHALVHMGNQLNEAQQLVLGYELSN